MKRIIIDCDPGLDDAVALLAAFQSKSLDVQAITTVAGNVPAKLTAYNARVIRDVAGKGSKTPVCAGAPRPIFRDPVTAEDFHGSTGLGNLPFPSPKSPLSRAHSVNMITRLCRAARSAPMILVVTGPMTNVALALTMTPKIREGIKEIVVMGGGDREGGNITPFAEFNIFADPHAAAIVFGSGLPIRCLSLDVTHSVRTNQARLDKVRGLGTKIAAHAADFLKASCDLEFSAVGDRDAPLHDPSTIIALTHPEVFKGRRATIDVVTTPGEELGRTIPTFREDGNVLWYEQADSDAAFAALCDQLGGAA